MSDATKRWLKVLDPDELPEGRVKAVTSGAQTLCMTHFEGRYGALDNRCPHQGGPLGEGSIEDGWLRCPWHGWDYHPLTGASPGGFDETLTTFDVEVRDDGVYVALDTPLDGALSHVRTATDVMAETMVAWGVRWVFGMVGHSNLGLADAIRRRANAGELHYVGIRHEGAASFAASAYGKLTGRPAACLSIAGPGATNLLTGLWDAHVDRAPVLALTGQVPTALVGRGAFQEVDLSAAFGGVAVHTATTYPHSDFAELMTLACKNAILKRGVSHLVFPDDVQTLERPDAPASQPEGRVTPLDITPPESALIEALARLQEAKRPVIIVGHGAAFAMDDVVALAEALDCPVITTFKAKGLIGDDHPLGCGVLGRSGTPIASWFMNEADLLVVFGASFSNHTGITSKLPTIQVDYEAMALGRFHAVDVPVWGEVGVTARLLRERLGGELAAGSQRDEIASRWALWRDEKRRRASETGDGGVHSVSVFDAMTRLVPDDAILAVDVGNNTYSFGRYFECKAQRVLMSGYLGSIGFGYPAAMGAWAATQEAGSPFHGRKVVAITGDGGFGQYMGELNTAVKYGMNITHVLLNNAELGKISKEQRAGQWDVWETSLHNPDFARYAELCGALGIRVTKAEALDAALEAALAHPGPSLVEVVTDPMLI